MATNEDQDNALAATVKERLCAFTGGMEVGLPVEFCVGRRATADELNGHKKTVLDSKTVARQHPDKTTEIEAKSGKPMAKTFRSSRGSLPSRAPRFINKFFG
jgi:hypothetical protein